MGDKSKIEWTSATWNPIRGCSRITPGCGGPNHQGGCYAEKIAARFSGPGQPFEGFAERTKHGGRWTGKLALVPELLAMPLRWRKSRRIFVNSMSDLFHEALPDEAIDKVFAVMALAPQHAFQVLTKRADRMREYLNAPGRQAAIVAALIDLAPIGRTLKNRPALGGPAIEIEHWPLPNVWLGVSVEDQQRADERIPLLLDTPAAVRWISAEPLLGPVDLTRVSAIAQGLRVRFLSPERRRHGTGPHLGPHLDWVVAGGESGPNARPAHPDWFRSLRDQCQAAGTAFFFKQWGAYIADRAGVRIMDAGGSTAPDVAWPDGTITWGSADQHGGPGIKLERVGKKAAGHLLDGREWREMPEGR